MIPTTAWRPRLDVLVNALVHTGALRSPEWEAVFRRVPRHPFVPRVIRAWPPREDEPASPTDSAMDLDRWLELVYSNSLLVIADDEEHLSSSSMPSMMARFLELLDVHEGNTVLEIGTGSGYNAALLSERLGTERVTSVDVDAGLIEAARSALASCGYAPTLAVQDGFYGYSVRAPYDRVIATCSVPHIPWSWVDLLAPAGVVVAPLANHLLVGLHRRADGSLIGRASSAAFMPLRSPALPDPPELERVHDDADARRLDEWFQRYLSSVPTSVPNFFAGLLLPDFRFGGVWESGPDQRPMLASAEDGAWAEVQRGKDGGYLVVQGGPRRLWDLYEAAVEEWLELGRPVWTRFGMTVTVDRRQLVWLDGPDSGHTWELYPRSRG